MRRTRQGQGRLRGVDMVVMWTGGLRRVCHTEPYRGMRILRQMLPVGALYRNVLSRLALAILSHRNFHREILTYY